MVLWFGVCNGRSCVQVPIVPSEIQEIELMTRIAMFFGGEKQGKKGGRSNLGVLGLDSVGRLVSLLIVLHAALGEHLLDTLNVLLGDPSLVRDKVLLLELEVVNHTRNISRVGRRRDGEAEQSREHAQRHVERTSAAVGACGRGVLVVAERERNAALVLLLVLLLLSAAANKVAVVLFLLLDYSTLRHHSVRVDLAKVERLATNGLGRLLRLAGISRVGRSSAARLVVEVVDEHIAVLNLLGKRRESGILTQLLLVLLALGVFDSLPLSTLLLHPLLALGVDALVVLVVSCSERSLTIPALLVEAVQLSREGGALVEKLAPGASGLLLLLLDFVELSLDLVVALVESLALRVIKRRLELVDLGSVGLNRSLDGGKAFDVAAILLELGDLVESLLLLDELHRARLDLFLKSGDARVDISNRLVGNLGLGSLEVLNLLANSVLKSLELVEHLAASALVTSLLVPQLVQLGAQLCSSDSRGRVLGGTGT